MKISIGSKIVDGPWGGGNLFIKNMTEYLLSQGHEVINNLSESNIDLILLTDPRNKRNRRQPLIILTLKNIKNM